MHEFARTALEAAEAAVRIHRRDQGRVRVAAAAEKGRADYVSRTDRDAQEAALAVIRARHPDHGVLAEEEDGDPEERLAAWDGAPLWVVDPLDGTANFLHGHPMYAASVALAVDGRPVAGAVVCGSSGERWWAARSEGAYKGGRRILVSAPCSLRDAMVGTGFPFKVPELVAGYTDAFRRVLGAAAGVRRAGAAALDLCFLAQGSFDAFWESFLNPWDFAAGWVIAEEAGGVLTRVDGTPLTLARGTVMGANGVELLDELGRVVR